MSKKELIINIDYILNEFGEVVFTKKYHLDRGYCCQSGCLNCPYGFKESADPFTPPELIDRWNEEE